jgi:ribonuclease HII
VAFRKAIKMANEAIPSRHEIATRTSYARNDNHQKIDFLLIDAFYIPYVKGLRRKNQKAIVKGDTKSISIAAASIIAKVHRDALMEKIGKRVRYRKYDWINNKGYGTAKHLSAIVKYGTNGYHRRQFVNTYLNNSSSYPEK